MVLSIPSLPPSLPRLAPPTPEVVSRVVWAVETVLLLTPVVSVVETAVEAVKEREMKYVLTCSKEKTFSK